MIVQSIWFSGESIIVAPVGVTDSITESAPFFIAFHRNYNPLIISSARIDVVRRGVTMVAAHSHRSVARELIAQELLGSEEEEFTTGVFSDGGSVSTITFRRSLGMGGLSREVVLETNPLIQELAESLARATGLRGCVNIQSRKVGDSFVPFEINPRISSTVTFRKKFGFDDTRWWIDSLEGKQHSYPNKFKSGYAFRYLTEVYLRME